MPKIRLFPKKKKQHQYSIYSNEVLQLSIQKKLSHSRNIVAICNLLNFLFSDTLT